ncbi:hypothetical protein P879_09814 [Paragonimus westermani]|uniref:Uncharacterized protein n=1 Tax=Paragonimus westermani TaxID=34504 RepID=A0A8T0DG51_9TREM|nr:hypothetical protein P879_09814 [Paragonimus westermani]
MFGYSYLAGMISQMCLIPLTGLLMDRIGLRVTKFTTVSILCVGSLFFAFASASTSYFLFPACIFVGVGSFASLFCNYHVCSMFVRVRGLTISLLSGVYDSSSAVAFFVSQAYPKITIQTSFIILACGAVIYGSLMAVFILTQKEEDMVPPGQNTLESHSTEFFSRQRLSDDESIKESEDVVDVNAEVLRVVNARYPNTKACFHDLPLYLFAFLYMTGLMRYSYFFARLNEQLDFAFDKDKAVVKHLLETSAAISMCGFFLSPITGFILDISRRVYKRKLKRRLNDPDLRLTDAEIYWTHLRALAPALYLLASCSTLISALHFVVGQQWLYYTLCVGIMLHSSILASTTTTGVMIAFPVTQFGVTIGIVTLVSGVFITLQYGLLEMPIRAANGVLVAISCLMYIPPLILTFKRR